VQNAPNPACKFTNYFAVDWPWNVVL